MKEKLEEEKGEDEERDGDEERGEGIERWGGRGRELKEMGLVGLMPQHESASSHQAQSIEGLWCPSQSRPRIIGYKTDTTPKARTSA